MKHISILVVILIMGKLCSAQPYAETPYKYLIEAAEESLEYNDYYNALEWYKKAYKESKDKDIYAKIANLHYLLRDYKRASKSFDRLLRKDKDSIYQVHRITYAKSLRGMGDYVEAMNQYKIFITDTEDEDDKIEAVKDLKGINEMNAYDDNVEAIISFPESDINSAFTEYGPAHHVDGSFYFTSFRRKKAIILDGDEGDYQAKIYVSSKDEKNEYGDPLALGNHINREDYNSGNVCFSRDGRRMYFVRTKLDRNEIIESKLYVSYRKDNNWTPASVVTGINGDYFVRHPSVGELYGREVLFFAADIPGGYGGFDLYYATFSEDDNFKTPINLGASINTVTNEFTPYYKEGTLYFSTEGLIGMGGLDIYYTSWDGSNWSEINNMGHGYNSPNDDFYFNIAPNGNNGSLVSNRPNEKKKKLMSETCCDDIYFFEISEIVIDLLANVNGDDGPLNAATAILIDLSAPDDESYFSKQNPTSNNFNFLLQGDHSYMLKLKHTDYISDSLFFNTAGIYDDFTVNKSITLVRKPIIPEIEIIHINEPIRLRNIYYDFDDATILRDAEKDLSSLVRLMNEYPDIVIELGSHTDAQGKDSYNQKLSQRRAESARKWMLRKKISPERIVAMGYGEEHILNQCRNGVRCSDDDHRINRRTEFKIIKGPETIVITKKVVKNAASTENPDDTSQKNDANKTNEDIKNEKHKEGEIGPKDTKATNETDPVVKPKKKKRKIPKKRKRRKVISKFNKNKKDTD